MGPNETLFGLLEGADPKRPALVDPAGPILTYGALREQVEAVAGDLAAAGVSRGDRVALGVVHDRQVVQVGGVLRVALTQHVPVQSQGPLQMSTGTAFVCVGPGVLRPSPT